MAAWGEIRARVRRDEAGFTLIELLVATAMALVLVGGAVSVFTSGINNQPRVSDKSARIAEGRVLMERVSREVRQGYGFGVTTSSQLAIQTYVNENPCGGDASTTKRRCLVLYSCLQGTCTRTVREANGTGTALPETLVTGLSSNDVFSYLPGPGTPEYIGLRLIFPATEGEDAITLEDGVALRNEISPSGVPG